MNNVEILLPQNEQIFHFNLLFMICCLPSTKIYVIIDCFRRLLTHICIWSLIPLFSKLKVIRNMCWTQYFAEPTNMGDSISDIVALRQGREYYGSPVMYDGSYLMIDVWFISHYLSNVIFIYWQFYYTSISARQTCNITFSLILVTWILFMALQWI